MIVMAQSFNAVSVSLAEAERENWKARDYKRHQDDGYKIDPARTKLNTVLKTPRLKDGTLMTSEQIVNASLLKRMLELNYQKEQIFKSRNQNIDLRQMYPVGKYSTITLQGGKQIGGKRILPYDYFKKAVERGNHRGKESTSSWFRQDVLQQFNVGLGNKEEWQNDEFRNSIKYVLNDKSDPKAAKDIADLLSEKYFKTILENFQKANPSMHVVQAVVHYDENNPHLHFTVLPHFQTGKGLGRVAFQPTIEHDHPEYTNNQNVIADWFNDCHNMVRSVINNTEVDIGGDEVYKMTLDDERPGTHKSMRTNEYNKRMAKLDAVEAKQNQERHKLETKAETLAMRQNEIEVKAKSVEAEAKTVETEKIQLAKQSASLNLKSDNLNKQAQELVTETRNQKNELVDTIDVLSDGKHKVNELPDKSDLKLGGDAPVSSAEGHAQHLAQSMEWLKRALSHLRIRLHTRMREMEQRAERLARKEAKTAELQKWSLAANKGASNSSEIRVKFFTDYKTGKPDSTIKRAKKPDYSIENGKPKAKEKDDGLNF